MGPPDKAIAAITEVIESSPRTTITNRSENRIDAVFVSAIFRFKDDVSFLVDAAANEIHYRSASRVGSSDLGANRKRMESLIPQIQAKL